MRIKEGKSAGKMWSLVCVWSLFGSDRPWLVVAVLCPVQYASFVFVQDEVYVLCVVCVCVRAFPGTAESQLQTAKCKSKEREKDV